MREILFRGKRVDNGEWVFGLVARIGELETSNIVGKEFDILVPVLTNTIGQYTGLIDKNGVKIFEGDIVSFDDCKSTESGYYELDCIGTVFFDLETASFCVTNRLMAESYEVLEECLVVGNIHDNLELLNGNTQ